MSFLGRVSFALLAGVVFGVMPSVVWATDTSIGNVMCTVSSWMTGNTGKGLATICVATVGVVQLTGKRKRTTSLRVLVGIAVLFGAASIVQVLSGGSSQVGCDIVNPFAP